MGIQPDFNAGLSEYPSKLYLETTTRCNLKCDICVKQSVKGEEGEFDRDLFQAIKPALPRLETLILNGIGEPLLYPHLDEIITESRGLMPAGSAIGFQTNGMLLDVTRALSLIRAGLNLICVSVDAVDPETFSAIRGGGDFSLVEKALGSLREAEKRTGKKIQKGIEFVLTRKNTDQLIPVLKWGAQLGISYAIITHLIPYGEKMRREAAYDLNTDQAIELYEKRKREAADRGIDITSYQKFRWKFNHTREEKLVIDEVESMITEATGKNIFLHLENLSARDMETRKEVEKAFSEAKTAAQNLGIDLRLPEIVPKAQKRCDFIETGSVFISWKGEVHPCHFLWHSFECYTSGWRKYVNPRVFGNLMDENIMTIWNSDEYREFRRTVSRYDYPLCSNCSFSPCDYIYTEKFEQDCYTNTIPCCDCQWCLGIFRCLS